MVTRCCTSTSANNGSFFLLAIRDGYRLKKQNWARNFRVGIKEIKYESVIVGGFFPRKGFLPHVTLWYVWLYERKVSTLTFQEEIRVVNVVCFFLSDKKPNPDWVPLFSEITVAETCSEYRKFVALSNTTYGVKNFFPRKILAFSLTNNLSHFFYFLLPSRSFFSIFPLLNREGRRRAHTNRGTFMKKFTRRRSWWIVLFHGFVRFRLWRYLPLPWPDSLASFIHFSEHFSDPARSWQKSARSSQMKWGTK